MPQDTRLQRYDYYKGPQKLDDLWTLTRPPVTMRCSLSTHAHGWQIRLTAGNFSRAQICKTETDVFTTADAWMAEAKGKGWK